MMAARLITDGGRAEESGEARETVGETAINQVDSNNAISISVQPPIPPPLRVRAESSLPMSHAALSLLVEQVSPVRYRNFAARRCQRSSLAFRWPSLSYRPQPASHMQFR